EVRLIAALFHVVDDPWTVSQLRHVKGRDVSKRHLHPLFRARRRDATDGVWRALRNIGRPIDGIDCDIELGGSWHPRPKLFAFKDAGCFVFHSLTDDEYAADDL